MYTIRDYLNLLPAQGYSISLPRLGRIAGIRPFPARKADMVDALEKYMTNEANIVGILGKLQPYEKELLEERIRSSGPLDENEVQDILKKNGVKTKVSDYSRFIELFDEYSPARLLFIEGSHIPEILMSILRKHVKPYVVKYTPVEESSVKDDIIGEIALGESFKNDFVRLIRLINTAKLSTTKESIMLTKAAVIKIGHVLETREVVPEAEGTIEEIRNSRETTRIFGMYMMLITAGIIREDNGVLALKTQAEQFVRFNPAEMCRTLLNAYMDSKFIYELDRIREIKIKTRYHPSFSKCREIILKHLCRCPAGKWISMLEFLKNIKKTDRYFLVDLVGEILSYSEYDRYYYSRMEEWYEIEGRFIEVVLLEYLNTIGIVDAAVSYGCHYSDYGDHETNYLSLDYFKLTPMGAFVIGATDKYVPAAVEKASGFFVQPNYDIVVSEGKFRQVHNLFFDRFAEKVADDVASIYKLTFKSIVKALDNGITVPEIVEYLEKYSSNPLPDNVRKTLEEWDRESKKIRIRKVTIIETDDKYLMEELKSSKSVRNHIKRELSYAAEIDGKSCMKVKREIEKKNHFCIME